MGKYDLVFTSPPFYTVEKYDNMVDWKSVEEFMNEFLIPLFKRSVAHLEPKGHIVLYIEDKLDSPFIDLMKEHVKDAHPKLEYQGAFYYQGYGSSMRPYYVWKLV
jgi:tRNA1(Val) A37 N6-methylase TrmN6